MAPRMPAKRGLVLGGVAIAVVVVALLAWWRAEKRRVDSAIEGARRRGGRARPVRVVMGAPRRLDAPAAAGARVVTSTREARDGEAALGRVLVATSGGVLVHGPDGGWERTLTFAEGLSSVDTTAIARWGERVAVGAADGALTLLDDATAQVVQFDTGVKGAAITELAADGELLYVGTRGAGLVVWDGRRAAVLSAAGPGASLEEITALAVGRRGVAVGTAEGAVLLHGDAGLTSLAPAGDRVTALAWDGDAVWVGRSFGLERIGPDRVARRVRDGVSVTALFVGDEGRIVVGTADEGVLVLEDGGRAERRVGVPGRISRLRRLDGRLVAFGDGGAWDLSHDRVVPLVEAPASLGGANVSALATRAGEVWVGAGAGIDVLDAEGAVVRRLARPAGVEVTALARWRADELVVATRRGAWTASGAGAWRITGADGDVRAVAPLAGALALATADGIAVLDADGGVRRALAGEAWTAIAWVDGGRLVAGGEGGLVVLDEDLRVEARHRVGAVRSLAPIAGGVVAATSAGVVRWTGDGATALERLGAPEARVVFVDGERLYAAGPGDAGLLLWQPGRRRWQPIALPLGAGPVTSIAADGEAFWFGVEGGVVRVPRAAITPAS